MLFIVFLSAVLPTLSFGLKCHQCYDTECFNKTRIIDPCRPEEHSPYYDGRNSRAPVCYTAEGHVKLQGDVTKHVIVRGCEGTGGIFDLEIGTCKTVQKPEGPQGNEWPFSGDAETCACDTDLCNGETKTQNGETKGRNGGTKIQTLLGFTFAAALLSTVLHQNI